MACGNENTRAPNERLLRVKQIVGPNGRVPFSRSTLWALVKKGEFPRPIKVTKGITAWRESEIDAFIAALGPGVGAKRNSPGPSSR
jgi:prophage regulatory protein